MNDLPLQEVGGLLAPLAPHPVYYLIALCLIVITVGLAVIFIWGYFAYKKERPSVALKAQSDTLSKSIGDIVAPLVQKAVETALIPIEAKLESVENSVENVSIRVEQVRTENREDLKEVHGRMDNIMLSGKADHLNGHIK